MYEVIPTERFASDVKYYIKKKGYRKIGADIKEITDELEKGNFLGNEIPKLSIEKEGHTYKVRTTNSSANLGKSNGFRIIYYVIKDDFEIYLLAIYSKKDDGEDRVSDKEIRDLVEKYCY